MCTWQRNRIVQHAARQSMASATAAGSPKVMILLTMYHAQVSYPSTNKDLLHVSVLVVPMMSACKQLIFLTDFVCVVPTAFHCFSYFSEWLLLRGRSASSLTCKVNKLHKTCPSICTYTVASPFLSTLKNVIYDIQYPLNKYLHFPLVLLHFPFARDSIYLPITSLIGLAVRYI